MEEVNNNILTKYAKAIVYIGLLAPSAYLFFSLWENEVNIWIPIGIAFFSIWIFSEKFVPISQVRIVKTGNIGPSEAFIPPGSEQWDVQINPDTGEPMPRRTMNPPVPSFRGPPNYMNRGGK